MIEKRDMRRFRTLAAVAGILVLSLGPAAAQGLGALHGRVTDPAGAPISGALITAPAGGEGLSWSAMSDPNGEFLLSLPPGRYEIKVVAPGFREASQAAKIVKDAAEQCDFVLRIPDVRETVNVTESSLYQVPLVSTATRTLTALRDVPQSITVVSQELMKDQMMMSIGDVVRYVPGITAIQGENNRDQLVIRGNSTSADFFLDGVRDDVQYYRDLYNLERVEALKGPNAMIFGRGGGGGGGETGSAKRPDRRASAKSAR